MALSPDFNDKNRVIFYTFVYANIFKLMSADPLHGKTLEMILVFLVDFYGWEKLGSLIRVNCFTDNPSISSSLKFLRKTDWARIKVEDLYIKSIKP